MFVQCLTKICVIFCYNQPEISNRIIGVLAMGIFSIKILAQSWLIVLATQLEHGSVQMTDT